MCLDLTVPPGGNTRETSRQTPAVQTVGLVAVGAVAVFVARLAAELVGGQAVGRVVQVGQLGLVVFGTKAFDDDVGCLDAMAAVGGHQEAHVVGHARRAVVEVVVRRFIA